MSERIQELIGTIGEKISRLSDQIKSERAKNVEFKSKVDELEKELLARGVLTLALTNNLMRAVTHMDVSDTDIDDALGRIEEVVKARSR